MLQIEPSERSRRRPLRGANTQTVPENSSAGLGERTILSTVTSGRVQTRIEKAQFVVTLRDKMSGVYWGASFYTIVTILHN